MDQTDSQEQRRSNRRATAAWFCLVVAFELVLAASLGLNRPLSGDEQHFVHTVQQFATGLNLPLLRSYEEMSGPLPFMLYAGWARLFGTHVASLRLCSLLIALLTHMMLWCWLSSVLDKPGKVWFASLLLLLNPYMAYLSFYVYTDMLAMLGLALALWAYACRRPVLLSAGLAVAVLSRQYLLFAVAATGVIAAGQMWRGEKAGRQMLAAAAVSLLPLAALVALWRGLSPDNQMKSLYVDQMLSFHPTSLVVYVACVALYTLPVLAWRWRMLLADRVAWVSAGCIGWAYLLWPVRASQVSITAGFQTVGVFHRLLKLLTDSLLLQDAAWCAFWVLGLVLLIHVARDSLRRLVAQRWDQLQYWNVMILWFFAVMPLSYLHWEKYALPLLPVLMARLLADGGRLEA
ncbi:MAG: hypothetical protein IT445_11700 [Phycisphaeraceae bacterium]|nr:hypothetical protein [Phycisphaeraceae bacterium]